MPTPRVRLPSIYKDLWTPSRYKAFHGGRGGAKSHSFAQALILMGAEKPLRVLCGREIQNSIAGSVKQLLDDKIIESGLQDKYHSTERDIRGVNGTQFMFAGLRTNPHSIKSLEGIDIAWVEEANTVSKSSLELLTPTIRKPGSEIWFSWNRRSKKDPVDDMFLGPGGPPPDSLIKKVGWRDNPWFPEVLSVEMEWDKGRDKDKWLHVWEGEPVIRSEARVFRNWRVEDIDRLVPAGLAPLYGADWGFSVDPTVLVRCYIFGRTLYFRNEAYRVRCEIDDTPALFAGDDEFEPPRWENRHGYGGVPGVLRALIVADSARPETISYMRNRGFVIRRAIKGPKSVEEGVEFMKSHDIVVHPDCTHVSDELTHYSYKEDPLTEEVLAVLADRKNHTIDACRYAVESARRRRRPVSTEGGEVIELEG